MCCESTFPRLYYHTITISYTQTIHSFHSHVKVCSADDTMSRGADGKFLRVAIKKIARPFQSAIHAKRTYRELRMLKHMNHENVRNFFVFYYLFIFLNYIQMVRSLDFLTALLLSTLQMSLLMCKLEFFFPMKDPVFVFRYMVTHLMGADLNNIIKTQKLSDDHVQFLVYQIVRGMKYVHSAGIIHRLILFFLYLQL